MCICVTPDLEAKAIAPRCSINMAGGRIHRSLRSDNFIMSSGLRIYNPFLTDLGDYLSLI